MSMSHKTAKKRHENFFLAKGNTFCKSRSSVTKLELLLLYYVMTNPYTKLHVNIVNDGSEKSTKQNFSKGQ